MKDSFGCLGFGAVLFAVFFALRLTGAIDWSWIWITAPLWIPLGVDVIASAVYLLWRLHRMKDDDGESISLSQRLRQMQEKSKEEEGRKEV